MKKLYFAAFLLGFVIMIGMMVSASMDVSGCDDLNCIAQEPTRSEPEHTCFNNGGTWSSEYGCICPPGGCGYCDAAPIAGYDCYCFPDGCFYYPYYTPPIPTPEYPVPPPPAGGFGGFLQVITGNTYYSSLEYNVSIENGVLNIVFTDENEKDIEFPTFIFEETYAGDPPSTTNRYLIGFNKVEIYYLTTGEFQINIGPDEKGEVRVIIFDGLKPQYVYGYSFNVYDILNP